MADYLAKRGANIAPSYATTDDLPASTQAGDLVFVGGQLGIAVDASTFKTCDKTDIVLYKFQGDTGGYIYGGQGSSAITYFAFSNDSSVSNVATIARGNSDRCACVTDRINNNGYCLEAQTSSGYVNTTDKTNLTSDSTAALGTNSIGSYSVGLAQKNGTGETKGFIIGRGLSQADNVGNDNDEIISFTYSSEAFATSSRIVTAGENHTYCATGNTDTHTYKMGGYGYGTPAPTNNMQDQITKFAHNESANASAISNTLGIQTQNLLSTNSATHVYMSVGGYGSASMIRKFQFSNETDLGSIGNLATSASSVWHYGGSRSGHCISSESNGYFHGFGQSGNTTLSTKVEKVSYSSDGNSVESYTGLGSRYGTGSFNK